jgi:predicted Zn-dependent peptidase
VAYARRAAVRALEGDAVTRAPRCALSAALVAVATASCGAPIERAAPAAPAPPPALAAPSVDFRATRPPPGPAPVFVAPRIDEARLANGVRVLVAPQHGLPVVFARVVLDGGAAQAAPGVSAFAGAMLLRGTTSRSAVAIQDEIVMLGAEVESKVDYDSTQIVARCLTPRLPDVLTLVADMVRRPAFSSDEIERERSDRLAELGRQRDRAREVARTALLAVLYPSDHPYATPHLGASDGVRRITRSELLAFYRSIATPARVTLVLAGDVDLDGAVAMATRVFGDWAAPKTSAAPVATLARSEARADAPKIVLVDRPGATQSHVLVGAVGVPRSAPDYDALVVMNAVLGSWDLSNRLYVNLREKHAYTYGAGSEFEFRRGAGPFDAEAALVRDHTRDGIAEMLSEISRMRTELVPDDELEAAKAALVRHLPASFETAEATARTLAELAVHHLPLDEPATRAARWARVTRDDVQRAAALRLDPSKLHVIVVGDAKFVRPELEALGLGEVAVRAAPR